MEEEVRENLEIDLIGSDGVVTRLKENENIITYSENFVLDTEKDGTKGGVYPKEVILEINNMDNILKNFTEKPSEKKIWQIEPQLKIYKRGIEHGKFYIKELKKQRSVEIRTVIIIAYDRLRSLLNRELSSKVIYSNITLNTYLTNLFKSLGLTESEFNIATSDTTKLDFTLLRTSKISSILNDISLAYDCYIYIDEKNVLQVQPKQINLPTTNIITNKITDDTNLVKLDPTNKTDSMITKIKVSYSNKTISATKRILQINNLKIKPNINDYGTYKLETKNLYEIVNFKIVTQNKIYPSGIECYQDRVKLEIESLETETKKVDIEVYGKEVEVKPSYVTRKLNGIPETTDQEQSNKEVVIDSILITEKDDATELANLIKSRLNLPTTYIQVEIIPDLDEEYNLYQIVQLTSEEESLNVLALVHTIERKWVEGEYKEVNLGLRVLKEIEIDNETNKAE